MKTAFESMRRANVEDPSRLAAKAVVEAARRSGLEDVAVATVDSPVGVLLVAGTRHGLVRVSYPDEPRDLVLEELGEMLSPRILEDAGALDTVRRELEQYFEGRRNGFDFRLDWAMAPTGFSRKVLEVTARIPFGSVSTYGQVATRAGSPRAARAAGNALHDNPIPIVVPCHRVIPSTGGIGKYGGSEWRKEFLLRLEGALDE
jgi:methylated-DNA-[protein]-cysteine S-methyltransferase